MFPDHYAKRPTVMAKGMTLDDANYIRDALAKDLPDLVFTVEPQPAGR